MHLPERVAERGAERARHADHGPHLLGPAPVEGAEADRGEVRAVVRVPRAQGTALSDALGELQRVRSARKLDPVRVRVDPVVL